MKANRIENCLIIEFLIFSQRNIVTPLRNNTLPINNNIPVKPQEKKPIMIYKIIAGNNRSESLRFLPLEI